jgi:hypothetical protein
MPTDDDDFGDDRPRRPRRDDDDDERPARRPRRDDGDDDARPARRRRDEDDDYDRPRRRPDRGAGLGIASMVIGIISLPLCLCSWFDIPLSLTAIILGFVSRAQGGARGSNTAGIICGFVSLLLIVILIALVLSGTIDAEKFKAMQNK